MGASATPLYDLVELSSLLQYTTYTTASGGGGDIIGLVDNATYSDSENNNTATQINELNTTADADHGVLTIDGVNYDIWLADPDNTSVTITDGNATQHIVSGDSGTSNVVFITAVPVGGGAARYFMVLDDWIGDIQDIASIQIGALDYSPAGNDVQISVNRNNLITVCFAAGTMIETPQGPRRIEEIGPGDLVTTLDNGPRRVLWTHAETLRFGPAGAPDSQRPIRFQRGALGPGMPARPLTVSPQHRMLLASKVVARVTGVDEVLVPAVRLESFPGVRRDMAIAAITYVHLMLASHEILIAEGAPAESLLPEAQAIAALPEAARAALIALAPAPYPPARPIIETGDLLHDLRRRLRRNRKPLIAAGMLGRIRALTQPRTKAALLRIVA